MKKRGGFLVGALAGLVITPYLTTRPIRYLRSVFARLSAQNLFAALLGLIVQAFQGH